MNQQATPGAPPQVVVVSGLSGAGKSTALQTLSDLGYYCVDNLPPPLVAETVRLSESGGLFPIALGLDIRVGIFLDAAVVAMRELEQQAHQVTVLFLDASDEVLVRRYSETRRPHPMLAARPTVAHRSGTDPVDPETQSARDGLAVFDGIRLERERLASVRSRATVLIDTTHLSVHELRRQVIEAHGPQDGGESRMSTRLLSFGFKYGLPLDADLVFDVRFLDNPYFVTDLRELAGTDEKVRDFVLSSPGCEQFLGQLEQLLTFALPRYEREGKSYLTVAIGCTGGRHRSVAICSALAERVRTATTFRVGIAHRDVARGGMMTEARVVQPLSNG